MTLLTFKAPKSGNIKTPPPFHPPDQNTGVLKLFNKDNSHNVSSRMVFSQCLRKTKHA